MQKFFTNEPEWDPNVPTQIQRLKWYQNLIVYGLKHGVPKALDWSKLYKVKEDFNVSPTDFLNRLREAATKYTNVDLESTEGKTHLVYLFVGQATNDRRRKLQKLEGAQDISKLLEVAWKVYQDRDPSDKGKPCPSKKGNQEKSSKKASPPMDKDRCAYCKKKGHWKAKCPMLKKKPPAPQLPLEQGSYSE